ncbi:MAG: CinA family nicotinamide mononucleotide deamidase-related protein [Saprospiraceae bacterium]
MNAYLLTIGDEILIGQIIDTNSAWMSRQLNLAGFTVIGKSSVGDTAAAIIDGLKQAMSQADIVILTGGLGPTKDDITKKTLAEFFGSDMAMHQETFDRIAAYFEKIKKPLPPTLGEHQASIPVKADVLLNKVGTAPGMWFEEKGKVVVSLPGVPFEMEYLMSAEVIPRLKKRFPGRPIVHRTLQTVGEGESNIAKRIENFENALPSHIKLAYLPSLGQVRLRLTGIWPNEEVQVDSEAILQKELDTKMEELAALLPDIVFGKEDDSLQRVLGNILLEKGFQFGTAESCTGGYVAHLMTSIPGASAYYPGSVVTYSYELKTKLLGVKLETLQEFGAVSEETVVEMAQGAINTLGVDISLAISGIAGPDGGLPDKPVGTVWMAVSNGKQTITALHVFGRDRSKNIQLSGIYGLNLVRKFLLEH